MKGVKYDKGKPRFSLLPMQAVWGIIEVLEHGSAKYEDHNWIKVEDPCTRYADAMLRHLAALERGDQLDPDSDLPHAWHMACSAIMLGWHCMYSPGAWLQWRKRQARIEPEPSALDKAFGTFPDFPEQPALPSEIREIYVPGPAPEPHTHIWELVHTDTLKAWHCSCGANVRETPQGRYRRYDANSEFVSEHSTYFQATHIP